jgi:hypothetical protein
VLKIIKEGWKTSIKEGRSMSMKFAKKDEYEG